MTLLTDDAFVRLFQERFGLKVDGVAGPATQAKAAELALLAANSNVAPVADVTPPVYVTAPTERIMLEIIEHEALVLEWYRDSEGVGTWGVGVTNASGHTVTRYKNAPQTVYRCLEVYEWLLRTKYLPEVLAAFKGRPLTEHELGGALSFHWNTGGIAEAQWVRDVLAGKTEAAWGAFLNWSKPKEIIPRRKLERDLFFNGKWSSDGLVTTYDVNRSTYQPDWGSAKQVDIRPELERVISAARSA